MQDIVFRPARPDDVHAIVSLLKRSELPYGDIDLNGQDFLVAVGGGKVKGTVGLEAAGEHGLLRSLAVDASYRDRGIGRSLLDKIIVHAVRKGVRELYLLTTTADKFFIRQGFEVTGRAAAPAALHETHEFKSACPASAVCMKKKIA
jgi:amino-acid N-acetyltransferase